MSFGEVDEAVDTESSMMGERSTGRARVRRGVIELVGSTGGGGPV